MKFASLVFALSLFGVSYGVTAHADGLKCIGTEPFWSASIDFTTTELVLQTTTADTQTSLKTKVTQALGTSGNYAFVAQGNDVTLSVTTDANCNDGMSDAKYSHAAMLLGVGQAPLFGCCL